MSVVAAVGPGAAASVSVSVYGQPLCGGGGGGGGGGAGGGARKRKDVGVVQDHQEAAEPLPPVGLRGSHVDARAAAPRRAAGLFVLETVEEEADAEAERSSIGAASEDEDEEDGEEVDSAGTGTAGRKGGAALASMDMDALDDALPIKRGLSNFFSGKSRSFANLQDAASAVTSARDLAKPENPFNKRRRVLRCCSIRRVSSTSLTALPPFFLLPTTDDDDDDGRSG